MIEAKKRKKLRVVGCPDDRQALSTVLAILIQAESAVPRDKPTAQVTVSKIVFGLNAQITGSDVGSGLNYNKCKYMINNSSTKLGENEALYTTGTFSGGSVSLKKVMAGGTYYVHVLVTDKVGNKNEIVSSSVVVDSVLNYAYTGSSQNVELLPGKYKLEVWGAQGGYANEKKSDFYSVISSNDLINGSCRRGNCTC